MHSKDRIEIAIRAGDVARSALELTRMCDFVACRLQICHIEGRLHELRAVLADRELASLRENETGKRVEAESKPDVCVWRLRIRGACSGYDTECGKWFTSSFMTKCPVCGKKVEVV